MTFFRQSEGTDSENEDRPVSRRRLLQTVGATGMMGGLAGCSGVTERSYEAPAVGMDENAASRYGYAAEPEANAETVTIERDLGVTNATVHLTTRTRTWKYVAESREARRVPEEVRTPPPDEGRASTPDGDQTPTPDDERTATPTGEGTPAPDEGTPVPEGDDGDGTDSTDAGRGGDSSETTPAGTNDGAPSAGQDGGSAEAPTPDAGDRSRRAGDGIEDRLVALSVPDPTLAGISLNPAAQAPLSTLITDYTGVFERICGCDAGDIEGTEVVEAGFEDTVSQDDVGGRVFGLDVPGRLPTTVGLMGEERPLRYFTFVSVNESDDLVAYLLLMAKRSFRTTSGQQTTVIVSYVGGKVLQDAAAGRPLVGSDGLFTRDEVATYVNRFAPVCPCLFEQRPVGTASGTGPGTESRTATPTPAPTTAPSASAGVGLLSEGRIDAMWNRAFRTPESTAVRDAANDTFGLTVSAGERTGYRIETSENGAGYVVAAPLSDASGYETAVYTAQFDAGESFTGAGIVLSQRSGDEVVVKQSFASVGEGRRDFVGRIRRGQVVAFDEVEAIQPFALDAVGGVPSPDSDEAFAVRRSALDGDRVAALPREEVVGNLLREIACELCEAMVGDVGQILVQLGCGPLAYAAAGGAGGLAGTPGGPGGAAGGATYGGLVAVAICEVVAGLGMTVVQWASDTTDCCMCYAIGTCPGSRCDECGNCPPKGGEGTGNGTGTGGGLPGGSGGDGGDEPGGLPDPCYCQCRIQPVQADIRPCECDGSGAGNCVAVTLWVTGPAISSAACRVTDITIDGLVTCDGGCYSDADAKRRDEDETDTIEYRPRHDEVTFGRQSATLRQGGIRQKPELRLELPCTVPADGCGTLEYEISIAKEPFPEEDCQACQRTATGRIGMFHRSDCGKSDDGSAAGRPVRGFGF